MKITRKRYKRGILGIVMISMWFCAMPAWALSVGVFSNPGGNAIGIVVDDTPFVQDGYDIVGTITLTETWTDPLLREVLISLDWENETVFQRWKVIKVITNNTGLDWFNFENELLVLEGGAYIQSIDTDGVDFAQGTGLPRTSTAFPSLTVDELASRDFMQFHGAILSGSGGVDTQSFFVELQLQHVALRQKPAAVIPEPSTILLLGAGLAGLGLWGRRKIT